MTISDNPGGAPQPFSGTPATPWQIGLELSQALRTADQGADVLLAAAAVIGRSLNLARAGFALIGPPQHEVSIAAEWRADGQASLRSGARSVSELGQMLSRPDRNVGTAPAEHFAALRDALARQLKDTKVTALVIPLDDDTAAEAVFFGQHHPGGRWTVDEALAATDGAERGWSVASRLESGQRLKESRVRPGLALESSGVATWEWDIVLDTIVWSDEHFTLLGYAPGAVEPSVDAWISAVHADDRAGARHALDHARDTQSIFDHTFRVDLGDGHIRWCNGRGMFFYAPDGQAVRMVGLLEDVTSRTETESELRDSEERLRLIVDGARDYAIFTTDANGVIDEWPPGAEAVFGWSSDEIVGQPAAILFVAEDRVIGAPRMEFDQARTQGYAPDVRWHLHKDGHRVFIDGAVRPLWRASNQLQGFLKIGQDVTRRRRDEVALRSSEDRFRVLTNAIPHLVFRGGAQGQRSWNSRQWLDFTGQDEEDARGLGWLLAIHPDDREATMLAWEAALVDGEYHVEHRIRRGGDGHYRWHQSRAVPVAVPDPAAAEWVGTSSDVHDRRQNQDQQRLMLAELQHRTYNLLAIVRAIFSETMGEATSLPEFRSNFSQRLGALSRVHGMLGQSENGRATIDALLRLELDALAADDSRITLKGLPVELTPASVQVLSLAVHELCTNAIKYGALADRRGQLEVSWTVEADPAGNRLLRVTWREDFGRIIDPPVENSEGFGRQLIEHALPYQLGAQTTYQLEQEFLVCTIELPLIRPPRRPLP